MTPMRPAARMRKQRLAAGAPELREFAAFFSDAYFETKAKHPTATYVVASVSAPKRGAKADEGCDARLLVHRPGCSRGAIVQPLHHADRILVGRRRPPAC